MRHSNAHDKQVAADIAALDALARKLAEPKPLPKLCAQCRHFDPWPSNPTAAVGKCGAGLGYFFPNNACEQPTLYVDARAQEQAL